MVPGARLNPFALIGSLYRWPCEPTGLWDSALEPIQHPISSRGGIHSPLIVRLNNFKSEGGKIKRSLFRSSFYAGTTAQLDAQFFNLVNSLDKSSLVARRHSAASTDASRSFSDMCRSMTTLGSASLFYDVLSLPEKVGQWAREMSVD